ncbi:MAG TPA: hypothetical protein VFB79_07100 [Candidatus Angelobacter sp.]|nr:hypothetical protein [Candidatus Angelobacter sp.]
MKVLNPDAKGHERTAAEPFWSELYETLTFQHNESVKDHQISRAASAFARDEAPQFDFDPQRIIHGHLHGWQDRIRISVDGHFPGLWKSCVEDGIGYSLVCVKCLSNGAGKKRALLKFFSLGF